MQLNIMFCKHEYFGDKYKHIFKTKSIKTSLMKHLSLQNYEYEYR